MARDKKIDMRWSEHEIALINEARGTTTFSEFVRDAAVMKAIEINDHD